jgi:predicted AAA+ superfamily ATPase
LPKKSFFLFGPRGSGKTTLLQTFLKPSETLMIDLLDPVQEDTFLRRPQELQERILSQPKTIRTILIDEIQKAPRLLDVVHSFMEKTSLRFVLTGSSARKLRRGASNLLAGRAFEHFIVTEIHRLKEFFTQSLEELRVENREIKNDLDELKKQKLLKNE